MKNEIGLAKLLMEQLNEEIRIQIIIHGDKLIDNTYSREIENTFDLFGKKYPKLFEIQYITSDIYQRLNVFIVDREAAVIIESNKLPKNKTEFEDVNFEFFGLATYTNSESTRISRMLLFLIDYG